MISLTRVGHRDDPVVGRIKAALHGKTYMDLQVLVCPAGGEFEIGVVAYRNRDDGSKDVVADDEVNGMVLMVLCGNLKDATDA